MINFSDWITRKYLEWRGDAIGREGTVSAFAKWVGVTQSVMSYWMAGKKIPDSARSINALVSRFGGEVYDVLGITPAVDIETENAQVLQAISDILKDIPRDKHGDLVFALRAWAATQGYTVSKNKKGEDTS